MVTSIVVVDKTASLVFNTEATALDGIYSLVAPDGSEWYKNPGYDAGTFGEPDFTVTNSPFELPLPLDMYGQIKETSASTNYIINLKVEGVGTPYQFLFKYAKLTVLPTINAPVQDCTKGGTTITYNANLPVGATLDGQVWLITAPDNTQTTQSGATLTLSPLVSGTYQIQLTVTYSYATSVGASEVFVTDEVVVPFSYVNTCGNSLDLFCKANCFLGKALAANATNQIVQLTGLMTYIWGNIQCGDQTASQPMFDLVMTRLQLDPANCKCGCK